jgi:hypothetical protein
VSKGSTLRIHAVTECRNESPSSQNSYSRRNRAHASSRSSSFLAKQNRSKSSPRPGRKNADPATEATPVAASKCRAFCAEVAPGKCVALAIRSRLRPERTAPCPHRAEPREFVRASIDDPSPAVCRTPAAVAPVRPLPHVEMRTARRHRSSRGSRPSPPSTLRRRSRSRAASRSH